ncbi:hypothetical protein B0A55_01873 [Friedmanniomyces simplex]|uniref:N-acetylgalactosaminide beta-1,3-galactosyltransferase n=1 Tax=Friedmanniomyces simplex TaxID=329884 RepID=A0A4U0XSP6_9PEZI|nr:hypothetical protein B0A55_01873 [Friedmanniomyces simplex]
MAMTLGRPKAMISYLLVFAFFGFIYTLWSVGYSPSIPAGPGLHDVLTAHTAITTPAADQLLLPVANDRHLPTLCEQHQDTGNLSVILMTGATEALETLSTQLVTSLRCITEPLIFSDLEQRLGSHVIYDVLANVSAETMDRNQDFDIYRKQHELVASGRENELRLLGDLPVAATGLEKYKMLHAIELAWQLQPDRDWYCFVGADTYLSWPNLLAFFEAYDPSEMWYFGQPIRRLEDPTGLRPVQGGAGFILSGRLVRDWNVQATALATRWDGRIDSTWPADYVLAAALDEELHVRVTDATPMLQTEDPAMVAFGLENWCKPVVTVDKLDPRQLDRMYQIELALNGSLLLFKDLHAASYHIGYPFKRDDWDNRAHDAEHAIDVVPNNMEEAKGQWEPKDLVDPHQGYMSCELACIQNEACFQFGFTTTTNFSSAMTATTTARCCLSRVFRLGELREPEGPSEGIPWTTVWKSGWRSDRIAKWVTEHRDCPF